MRTNIRENDSLEFHPVTRNRLADLDRFSITHGKFRCCSCMRWRLASSEYARSSKDGRVSRLAGLVRGDAPVGVLGYASGEPIAWCSVAPRETLVGLECCRALGRIDPAPVWSVVCFFVDRKYRRRHVTVALLRAAVEYARSRGACIVEGYPVEPGARLYTYIGSPSTFVQAGFRDVTPAGRDRRVFRCVPG